MLLQHFLFAGAAQAGLNILYDLPKYTLKQKFLGIPSYNLCDPFALLTRGFDETFFALIHVMLVFLLSLFNKIQI